MCLWRWGRSHVIYFAEGVLILHKWLLEFSNFLSGIKMNKSSKAKERPGGHQLIRIHQTSQGNSGWWDSLFTSVKSSYSQPTPKSELKREPGWSISNDWGLLRWWGSLGLIRCTWRCIQMVSMWRSIMDTGWRTHPLRVCLFVFVLVFHGFVDVM